MNRRQFLAGTAASALSVAVAPVVPLRGAAVLGGDGKMGALIVPLADENHLLYRQFVEAVLEQIRASLELPRDAIAPHWNRWEDDGGAVGRAG